MWMFGEIATVVAIITGMATGTATGMVAAKTGKVFRENLSIEKSELSPLKIPLIPLTGPRRCPAEAAELLGH